MNNDLLKIGEITTPAGAFAVGNDLVFLPDFEHSLTPEFKARVFTEREIAYCSMFDDSLLRYASTWAGKEAVYKVLKQIDNRPIGWKKIEITRDKPGGQPKVMLHDPGRQHIKISLTITHDGAYAWAIAMAAL